MRETICNIILFAVIITLAGCKNNMQLSDDGIPEVLVIGVFAGDDPDLSARKLEDIGKYLKGKLGIKEVKFIQTSDYTAVIEALRSRKVHMAYLSPFSYVLASGKIGITPLVTMGVKGETYSYRSVIMTSKKSGLKNMDDVRARSKELTLCFSDPASTSGHFIPRAYLTSIGLDPQNSFKQTLFSSSNGSSVLTVAAQKVDVGCAWENSIPKLVRQGNIEEGEVIVLWRSDPLVSSPIVIRNDINKEFAERVKQAYMDMAEEQPAVLKDYLIQYFPNAEGFHYVAAYDSMYNGIRKISGGIHELNLIQ